ncbi:hypothetical protein H310_11198 [Aphanomyces invadans]|uniref:Proteasome assembly chaperone 1 n=1 Tax=Aphanomyces invadans TaxID=157072 RepID=A0A024TMP1_9STRA|nr:hypothetical protein H310_11198 [Aphanomyces invadans]ETV95298.1 hypothetical protein H310_11198 [Aphanomyces invadans]|eukprot:XP_008875999.1 hypothetical protein H310_11198 [Aphanomyces invadans]
MAHHELADAVVLGYRDLSAAGVRLLHHVTIDGMNVMEESLDIHGQPLLIRNFVDESTNRPKLSVLIVPGSVPADLCTLMCAEIVDLLQGSKNVLVLSSLNLPMTSEQEHIVFWKQLHTTTPLALADLDFEPVPANSRWTVKDQFLSTLLHFLHVEYLPVTLLVVRGYKYSNSPVDGTTEVLLKLGHATPVVMQELGMATKVAVDVQAAAALDVATATDQFSTHSLLYN